ncbi:transforming growth factor-beta-induced protein ig-h3-like [Lingula anatina]|uniref:Transforming growth factor-beta-induced protein ig-h3-like n=1 Tax=Lingula anatina TaxID=7574 RepID=A0A1S3IK43_LINAN|nr:transforming growth factor-beta-induced protein ig-h3-like [Lingula anatina]|eukprot:XP_013398478.1 transforming growth factor-beta-induced protein ig-h3-like [Lingula anatina]
MAPASRVHVILVVLVCSRLSSVMGTNATESVVDVAANLNASIFVDFVEKLPESLSHYLKNGKGPFTLFVPTNAAFAKLPANIRNQLQTNKTYMMDVMSFHIGEGLELKTDFINERLIPTLYSANTQKRVRLNVYQKPAEKVYTASGAPVSRFDELASNGVVHLLDQVMYHLPSQSADDVIVIAPEYLQLDYLIEMSGLNATTIAGGGPFTFFAPTNEAIYSLPPGAMYEFEVNHMALIAVLQHHIVKGTYYAAGLYNGQILQSYLGQDLKVILNGTVVLESVDSPNTVTQVTSADVSVTDGVMHGVNRMMLVRYN